MRIDSQTCHSAGGVFDAIRSSITKLLIGGMKLRVTESIEFGSRDIGIIRNQGSMRQSITGIISD